MIPSDCAVTDFSPSSYGFLAYTAADGGSHDQIRDLFECSQLEPYGGRI
ncbi:MAG: hypothetical protein ACLUOI_15835 [Eisenbergiella sp.]